MVLAGNVNIDILEVFDNPLSYKSIATISHKEKFESFVEFLKQYSS